jgi:hypothetical protein
MAFANDWLRRLVEAQAAIGDTPQTGGFEGPSQAPERVARQVSPAPDELAARRDLLMPGGDQGFLRPRAQFDDRRYQRVSRDESQLARLLSSALNPDARHFDSVDSGRSYQPGIQTNTTDNARRGQRYASFVKGGNLYHEYVVNGRRRRVLVGPADRKLF